MMVNTCWIMAENAQLIVGWSKRTAMFVNLVMADHEG